MTEKTIATYTIQIVGPDENEHMQKQRVLSNLPAMLEAVEEDLWALLPEGFSAHINQWNEEAKMEPLSGEHAEEVREIARQEIASLGGLVLRRLQDMPAGAIDKMEFASIFGEVLRDFSAGTGEPGEKTTL